MGGNIALLPQKWPIIENPVKNTEYQYIDDVILLICRYTIPCYQYIFYVYLKVFTYILW